MLKQLLFRSVRLQHAAATELFLQGRDWCKTMLRSLQLACIKNCHEARWLLDIRTVKLAHVA
jgi:hypothetical protein